MQKRVVRGVGVVVIQIHFQFSNFPCSKSIKQSSKVLERTILLVFKVLPNSHHILARPAQVPSQNPAVCMREQVLQLIDLLLKVGVHDIRPGRLLIRPSLSRRRYIEQRRPPPNRNILIDRKRRRRHRRHQSLRALHTHGRRRRRRRPRSARRRVVARDQDGFGDILLRRCRFGEHVTAAPGATSIGMCWRQPRSASRVRLNARFAA